MARWNKNVKQGFTVPVDIDDKDTNRPVAARSAGTVGKWGCTSFASIRSGSIAYPRMSDEGSTTTSNKLQCKPSETLSSAALKPKKFFKSRNIVSNSTQPQIQTEKFRPETTILADNCQESVVIKRSTQKNQKGKLHHVVDNTKEVDASLNKNNGNIVKTSVSRSNSRSRKQINYQENKNKRPKPVKLHSTKRKDSKTLSRNSGDDQDKNIEHPPIVLRISKGTSRLLSTDSEGMNSPPNLSPIHVSKPASESNTIGIISSTAELLAVLSDDTPPPELQPIINKDAESTSICDSGGIKLKIKTINDTQKPFKRVTRASNRNILKSSSQPVEENTPDLNDKFTSNDNIKAYDNPHSMNDFINEQSDEDQNTKQRTDNSRSLQTNVRANITRKVKKPNKGQKVKNVSIEQSSAIENTGRMRRRKRNFAQPEHSDEANNINENISSNIKGRGKRTKLQLQEKVETNETTNFVESTIVGDPETVGTILKNDEDNNKPSVKLVISKKKGSIFKSREVADSNDTKKRYVYNHKWDDMDGEKSTNSSSVTNNDAKSYANNFDEELPGSSGQVNIPVFRFKGNTKATDSVEIRRPEDIDKEGFTLKVRNVKKAYQIQEIGEFQEMDDDVEYLLDALQCQNPISTRCLSAIQLASKCMVPAFRMHVRAHGIVTKFFKTLQDAHKNQSLGLCTATVMFVLSIDTLNMDLDRDSLELMLNLLDTDVAKYSDTDRDQYQRNLVKVREICDGIKAQGKAVHLNIDNITVGSLAMETLLSLTSKRAGEWFKEELRNLGGLEHIIKTICECCRQISDYVVDWTELLLEKLRKIERCLRVLENVTQLNQENQNYILSYDNGIAVQTLVKLYKLCDSEIVLYPTTEKEPKESPGVVIREALIPTLKVLINLTHSFNEQAPGSSILGQQTEIFHNSLHILLQAPFYLPESSVFEFSLLVLLLLINLTMYTIQNRKIIMEAVAPVDFGNQFNQSPAIKALIEYFYYCEDLARIVEKNTDAILENPQPSQRKKNSQEEKEETLTKLVQTAGNHMEHSMKASYVCLLIGQLIMNSAENESKIRQYLKRNSFKDMINMLEKYYNFMNLTASSESFIVQHINHTRMILRYLKKREEQDDNTIVPDNTTCDDDEMPQLNRFAGETTRTYSRSNNKSNYSANR